jgi:biotin/methionine sulfoxide reductase
MDTGPGGAPIPHKAAARENVGWHELATETDLVLAFGGLPLKNTSVSSGGTSQHIARDHVLAAHRRGTRFHLISPLRDDLPAEIGVGRFTTWAAPGRPCRHRRARPSEFRPDCGSPSR